MPWPLAHIPRNEARAVFAALVVAVVLSGVKFTAYFLTGSAAVFSDALESVVNVAAASFALYSLYWAHQPADRDHPYGHGKIEFLSAGFEGSMILLAAAVAAAKALENLLRVGQLRQERLTVGITLLGVAFIANAALGMILLRTGRKTSSETLEADGHHLLSDAVTSIAAIAGLTVVHFTGLVWADSLAALSVACYIAWVGAILIRRSVGGLMDRQDTADQTLLRGILDSHIGPAGKDPRICSYHKLRHRHSGRYHWVDFHIMVPGDWNIRRGHEIASAIEYEIELALKEGNATAHIEPCVTVDCPLCTDGAREREPLTRESEPR